MFEGRKQKWQKSNGREKTNGQNPFVFFLSFFKHKKHESISLLERQRIFVGLGKGLEDLGELWVSSQATDLLLGLLFHFPNVRHSVLEGASPLDTLHSIVEDLVIVGLLLQDVEESVVAVVLHAVDDREREFPFCDVLTKALSFHVLYTRDEK